MMAGQASGVVEKVEGAWMPADSEQHIMDYLRDYRRESNARFDRLETAMGGLSDKTDSRFELLAARVAALETADAARIETAKGIAQATAWRERVLMAAIIAVVVGLVEMLLKVFGG